MEHGRPRSDRLAPPHEGTSALAVGDAVLAHRIRFGEADALGELFDRDGAAALAVATALVRHPAVAEDIVHDAFVKVWQTIGEFDGSLETLAAWVVGLTTQQANERLTADGHPGASLQ